MDALRKLVIEAAAMTTEELHSARERLAAENRAHPAAKTLVLNLIDLYLRVGEDPDQRAAATEACLDALDAIEI